MGLPKHKTSWRKKHRVLTICADIKSRTAWLRYREHLLIFRRFFCKKDCVPAWVRGCVWGSYVSVFVLIYRSCLLLLNKPRTFLAHSWRIHILTDYNIQFLLQFSIQILTRFLRVINSLILRTQRSVWNSVDDKLYFNLVYTEYFQVN